MAVKHFAIGNSKVVITKSDIKAQEKFQKYFQAKYVENDKAINISNSDMVESGKGLKCVYGRVVIAINLQSKNWHTMPDGTTIRLERQYNNLNRRETEPVNAFVIDADNIPKGAEILIHPNEIHDVNRIFNFVPLSGKEAMSDIRFYSIHEPQCFAWRMGTDEWKPTKSFDFAVWVYNPYKGLLDGIDPTLVPDTLYVTTGELKGQVVKTLKASDYCIIFQEHDGKERRLIRFRPFGDIENNRESEAIMIMDELTAQVENNELYIGVELSDAKPLK